MYSTHCTACEKREERKLTFAQYDQAQAGDLQLDCSCGGSVELVFDPSDVAFVLKDGESGGFVSKAMKENAYRRERRKIMAQRERDHVRPNTLQPNFQGRPTSSWKEAQDAAYQSTYDKVKGEHGTKVAAEAATKSAQTYNKHIKREVT
jgi:hypothetical protein